MSRFSIAAAVSFRPADRRYLFVIAAKHAWEQVTSPGGYLREFVTAHSDGQQRLDHTLFGLTERAGSLRQYSRARVSDGVATAVAGACLQAWRVIP